MTIVSLLSRTMCTFLMFEAINYLYIKHACSMYANFCVTTIKYTFYEVQDWLVLYNILLTKLYVRVDETLAWSDLFTKKGWTNKLYNIYLVDPYNYKTYSEV